jgi:2-phospho-L-lactate guanylyltransferase
MRPWLLIPVKSLDGGKSRLASVLSAAARRELNEQLLHRMLKVATRFPGMRRTAVVSPCGGALELAKQYGAYAIRERRPRGLNAAAAQALRSLRRRGAGAVMVSACDLPRLRADDLSALARRASQCRRTLLLCPDESGTGTNALYICRGSSLRFRFGKDSLRRHRREARRRGLAVEVYLNARIAGDIDTPGQWHRWRNHPRRR